MTPLSLPLMHRHRVLPWIGGSGPGIPYLGKDTEGVAANQAVRSALVVDDETLSRTVTGRMLVAEGFQVHEAASGKEALRYIETHPGTMLAVVDIVMPEMDGVTLASRLAEVAPACRIILMTGYAPTQVALGTLIDRFSLLLKPFNQAELKSRILHVFKSGEH